ncbi:MAG: alpha/beta fold hydrolase [Anaerolineales bacterium]|nr:alpha/beta fold hydrolase [Anaerolineales bacterium]
MTLFSAGLDGVTFLSQGCRLVGGLYRAAGATPRPSVILLHGLPGTEQNLDIAYGLRAAGINCLFFHYRGCWGSAGVYNLAGLADDVRAAADWLTAQPCVDPARLALVGYSLGGHLTLAAGAADPRYKALAALCPLIDPAAQPLDAATFAEFAELLNGLTGAELQAQWAALPPIPPLAGQLARRPLLLVTAGQDAYFPPAHYQHFPGDLASVTWWRFPTADHVFSHDRPSLVQTIVGWLQKVL